MEINYDGNNTILSGNIKDEVFLMNEKKSGPKNDILNILVNGLIDATEPNQNFYNFPTN